MFPIQILVPNKIRTSLISEDEKNTWDSKFLPKHFSRTQVQIYSSFLVGTVFRNGLKISTHTCAKNRNEKNSTILRSPSFLASFDHNFKDLLSIWHKLLQSFLLEPWLAQKQVYTLLFVLVEQRQDFCCPHK